MSNILPSGSSFDQPKPQNDRRVRHGLIEDWRDAVGILLLLAVAAFFGALIARMWPDTEDVAGSPGAELSARIASLENELSQGKSAAGTTALRDRLARLEQRVSRVETSVAVSGAASGAATIAISPLSPGAGAAPGTALSSFAPQPASEAALKHVEELATRLGALENRTATAPDDIKSAREDIALLSTTGTELASRINGVAERLQKLESSDLIVLAKRASLAASIANLTRAAQGSSPFRTEYDIVAALVPGDAHLAKVAPFAGRGIPTTGTLISSFGNNADAALDAESLARGKTWGTQLWANFASLVTWRTTGDAVGNTTESRLARAELRLKAGDLDAAVKELLLIRGAARKPLAPWLADATARVTIETSLAGLNSQAIEAITGPVPVAEAPAIPDTAPKAKTP